MPVVIRNYMDESGNMPNQGNEKSSWVLSRRFFIFDSISGIKGNSGSSYRNGIKPEYVRWAGNL